MLASLHVILADRGRWLTLGWSRLYSSLLRPPLRENTVSVCRKKKQFWSSNNKLKILKMEGRVWPLLWEEKVVLVSHEYI